MAIFAVICNIIAALILFVGVSAAKGAPQEAATAAIALCVAVIPYVLYRVSQDRKALQSSQKLHKELIAELRFHLDKSAVTQKPSDNSKDSNHG